MSYKFSSKSKERLSTVDPKARAVMYRALELSKIDFGIPEYGGMRTAEDQNQLYKDGKSKCDGYVKVSEHQSGFAVDVYAFVGGKASWEPEHLSMVACAVLQASSEFGVKCEWGGLWSKGMTKFNIDYGWDLPHFQFEV